MVLAIGGHYFGLITSARTLEIEKSSIIQTLLEYIPVRVLDNRGKNIWLKNYVSTLASNLSNEWNAMQPLGTQNEK